MAAHAAASPNVELVRTGIERIVPDGVVTVDGELREADVICYATGFRHNDFLADRAHRARRRVAARAVGRRADRVPRHHDPELPEPVLPVRAGHEPRARREPVLPLRVPDPLRDGLHPPGARGRRAAIEVRNDVHDDYAERLPARDRPARVGAPVDQAQPLQEPAGQGVHALAVAASSSTGSGPGPPTPTTTSSPETVRRDRGVRRPGRGWLTRLRRPGRAQIPGRVTAAPTRWRGRSACGRARRRGAIGGGACARGGAAQAVEVPQRGRPALLDGQVVVDLEVAS